MKSNIEKVYSKLPQKKHNFKKQKVELESVQVLEDTMSELHINWRSVDDLKVDFQEEYNDMLSRVSFIENAYDVWKENLDKVQNALVDFEAKAKDLGVNPMDFKGYSDAYYQSKDYVDEVQELSDKIKQMQNISQI
jgi:predicted nucleotidyltransferase